MRLQWTQSTVSNTSWEPSGAGAAFLVERVVSVSFVTATCLISTIPAADHGAPSRLALGWARQWIHGRSMSQAESVSELIDLITITLPISALEKSRRNLRDNSLALITMSSR